MKHLMKITDRNTNTTLSTSTVMGYSIKTNIQKIAWLNIILKHTSDTSEYSASINNSDSFLTLKNQQE